MVRFWVNRNVLLLTAIIVLLFTLSGCGIYSFTGASIAGKTINVRPITNRAGNVSPALAATMADKIRNRILSQTGLAPVNTDDADYEMNAVITGYNVSYSGVSTTGGGVPQVSQNRLTVTIEVDFKNKIDEKASFKQSFNRFADFDGNKQLQSVEIELVDNISGLLAEDIFNKAFVNW